MVENQGPTVNELTGTNQQVKLISNDNKVFFVNREVICQSQHIKTTLAAKMKEGTTAEVKLDFNANTLEQVCKYLHYRIINQGLEPELRAKFDLAPEDALSVLNAAIYLQC